MAVVETERHGQILVVRMNRPERLNALNHEMRTRWPRPGPSSVTMTGSMWRSLPGLDGAFAPART